MGKNPVVESDLSWNDGIILVRSGFLVRFWLLSINAVALASPPAFGVSGHVGILHSIFSSETFRGTGKCGLGRCIDSGPVFYGAISFYYSQYSRMAMHTFTGLKELLMLQLLSGSGTPVFMSGRRKEV